MKKISVLYVEDYWDWRNIVAETLKKTTGFKLKTVAGLVEADKLIAKSRFDAVICVDTIDDFNDGLRWATELREK